VYLYIHAAIGNIQVLGVYMTLTVFITTYRFQSTGNEIEI